MPSILQKRLEANGSEVTVRQMTQITKGTHDEFYPEWTVDELLLHPEQSMHLCEVVRRQTKGFGLPDDLILRIHLNNNRKNKR